MSKKQQHLISLDEFSCDEILELFKLAEKYLEAPFSNLLQKKTLVNLFFENSTRTRSSFEIAARNLSAEVVNIDISTSSLKKGESDIDTILTIEAMNPDFVTIRHSYSGIVKKMSKIVKTLSVINSGDGSGSHPTQALLDCFTIYKRGSFKNLEEFKGLKVAICGDIINSRVARSNIELLTKLRAEIRLIGPVSLLPKYWKQGNIEQFNVLNDGIKGVDVIQLLRIQKERMRDCSMTSNKDYFNCYGITEELLAKQKKRCFVMHPGPMNQGVEIERQVASNSGRCSVIEQVSNGVAMRQAILHFLNR